MDGLSADPASRASGTEEISMLDGFAGDVVQLPGRYQVRVDRSRDALLTEFGRATLNEATSLSTVLTHLCRLWLGATFVTDLHAFKATSERS